MNFNYFFTRKLNFMKESHAIALFPGGFGTMDEGFEALTLFQTGKAKMIPLVLVDEPNGHYWKTWYDFMHDHLLKLGLISEEDFSMFRVTTSVEDAIGEIKNFYKIYQSSRYVGEQMVIRLATKLDRARAHQPQRHVWRHAAQRKVLPGRGPARGTQRTGDGDCRALIFTPHRRNFGRMRLLIDAINGSETEPTPA